MDVESQIEAALIEFRRKVEEIKGQPLISAQLDFTATFQQFCFKDDVWFSINIKPENVYVGHWYTSTYGGGSRYFFEDELKRGEHRDWGRKFEKEYNARVKKILGEAI